MTDRLALAIAHGNEHARAVRAEAAEREAARQNSGKDTVYFDKGPSLPAALRILAGGDMVHTQTRW